MTLSLITRSPATDPLKPVFETAPPLNSPFPVFFTIEFSVI